MNVVIVATQARRSQTLQEEQRMEAEGCSRLQTGCPLFTTFFKLRIGELTAPFGEELLSPLILDGRWCKCFKLHSLSRM